MKRSDAVCWSVLFTVNAIIAPFISSAVPLYSYASSSVIQAVQMAFHFEDAGQEFFAQLVRLYVIAWFIYLLVCCVLSFWGIVKPMVAALGADLVFAAVFILYEVITAKPDLAEYVQYWSIGAFFRLLFLIGSLWYIWSERKQIKKS